MPILEADDHAAGGTSARDRGAPANCVGMTQKERHVRDNRKKCRSS